MKSSVLATKSPTTSKAQIITTIGPASSDTSVFLEMAKHQADIARLNFAWGDPKEKTSQINTVREVEKKLGRHIPIIADLPGPRIQNGHAHSYKKDLEVLTNEDIERIKFCIEQGVDYFALSFIGSAHDVKKAKEAIAKLGGKQKVIAKIERKVALESIAAIVKESDAVMIARGDLISEIPLEQLPFAQAEIISECNRAGKPVITATEMLLSMKENPTPTRAEITDVSDAIVKGSDAVMLSEETSIGKYPVETVTVMEKIVLEAEKHSKRTINQL